MKMNFIFKSLCSIMRDQYISTKKAIGIILFICTMQTINAQSFNSNLATLLQDSLTNMVATFTNTKGMSVSVALPGQGIWTGSSGLSYAGNPLTTDMVLGLASNSKLYTAVMMLKLQESGLVDLDDPISLYIPTYPNINPGITIRQLLNHTSGVNDPFFATALLDTINAHPTQIYTPNDVLAWVGPPLFAPGSSYSYSNINYILAGMVAQSVTGLHISQLIRDSLLNPLDLDSTFYDIEEPITGNLAHRWVAGADLHDTSRISLNTAGGAAGSIFATASEVAQWYHALMNGQIINEASLAEMTNFLLPGNYGLGIQTASIFGHTYWGHSGGTFGYRTKVMYDPCMDATVVGLANNSEAAEQGITALLFKIIWDLVPSCPGSIIGTASVCRGETGIIYTVPPINHATSYVWTLPNGAVGTSNTNSIVVDFTMAATSGDIIVCGNSNYGVGASTSFSVIVNEVPTNITEMGDSLIMADSTADSYQWINCDLGNQLIVGANNQIYEPEVMGSYAVIITSGGCVDTSDCTSIDFTGVDQENVNSIFIYPNPSNGFFKLGGSNLQSGTVQIYNSFGQLVYQAAEVTNEVNLSNQPKGAYYLRIISEEDLFLQKIIIE